jgi:hypothetical protein
MANRFLTTEEVAEDFLKVMLKDTKGMSRKEQRAYFYDLQTTLGAFPHDEAERKRYIETEEL